MSFRSIYNLCKIHKRDREGKERNILVTWEKKSDIYLRFNKKLSKFPNIGVSIKTIHVFVSGSKVYISSIIRGYSNNKRTQKEKNGEVSVHFPQRTIIHAMSPLLRTLSNLFNCGWRYFKSVLKQDNVVVCRWDGADRPLQGSNCRQRPI